MLYQKTLIAQFCHNYKIQEVEISLIKLYEHFFNHQPPPNFVLQKRLPMFGSKFKRQSSCDSDSNSTSNNALVTVVSRLVMMMMTVVVVNVN